MSRWTILVVDDEPGMQEVCRDVLEEIPGSSVVCRDSAEAALEFLDSEEPDLVVTDIRMAGRDGVELLQEIRHAVPGLPVVLMTAFPTVETAVQALRLGAADYLIKPFRPEELLAIASRLLEDRRLRSEHRLLERRAQARSAAAPVARSAAMGEVLDLARRVAATDTPVLITGETGTGKEVLARFIHAASPRAAGRFVPVDCSGIPESLVESEFFGHERGAFTGARERGIGLFEYADGGTVFLDEIGELPLALQPKLLRVLQEGCIRRVGGRREIPVDVRIEAATHRDLEAEVEAGRFREDLYYRLAVVRIHLPPLRERPEDIEPLARRFLEQGRREAGSGSLTLEPEFLEALKAYAWPGNVRQLQNVIRRAMALAPGPSLGVDCLPDEILLAGGAREEAGFRARVARFEREYLERLLRECGGRVQEAAERARLPRATFYRLLAQHGLQPQDYRPAPDSSPPNGGR